MGWWLVTHLTMNLCFLFLIFLPNYYITVIMVGVAIIGVLLSQFWKAFQ